MGQANALLRGRYRATSPQAAVDAVITGRIEDAARQLPNTPIGDRLGGASNSPATRVTNEIRRQVGELRLSISQARRIDLQQANALLSSWTCR